MLWYLPEMSKIYAYVSILMHIIIKRYFQLELIYFQMSTLERTRKYIRNYKLVLAYIDIFRGKKYVLILALATYLTYVNKFYRLCIGSFDYKFRIDNFS